MKYNKLSKKINIYLLYIFIIFLSFLPLILSSKVYLLSLFSMVYLNIIILMGLVIILGFTRQFSLGQVAFYGIGAYTTAILTKDFNINFFIALIISGLIAGLISLIVAIPGSRFKGPWLALVTFAFAEVFRILMIRLKDITGGFSGFFNIPKPVFANIIFNNDLKYYYIFFIVMLFSVYIAIRIERSELGRVWKSIGSNENIALSVGTNIFLNKLVAFFIGSFIAGLAGGLYAAYANFISPDLFTVRHTIFYLSILVVGGLASIPGAILSSLIFTFLQSYLRSLYPWDLVLYGLIIILIINFLPKGIGEEVSIMLNKIKRYFNKNLKKST